MMTDRLCVTTTVDSEEAAARLAGEAVAVRLAACAQVEGPVASAYWWDGEMRSAQEWRVVYKTSADRVNDLMDFLSATHPYDVPEIIATPITAGYAPYLEWIGRETRPAQQGTSPADTPAG